jgi:signal transduction histidine kinase
VRRRLTIAIVAVAGGSVALFALPLGIVLRGGYRDQELLRLQRDTVAAARLIDLGAAVGDQVELPHGSDQVAVYDATGRRVAGTPRDGPARADAVALDTIANRRPATGTGPGQLIAAVPLLTGERVSGAIRAQRSDHVVAGRTHRAWLALAGAAAGVVLLALVAALLLGRRLARPLEKVAAAARRLGEGDFSVRAPRGRVAEVDAVAEALDATAARLHDLITRERAFSADASHQLRTPLAALRLELETVQLTRDAPAADLDRALAQIDRLEQTIQTLLAVARDIPGSEATCDVGELLDAAQVRWNGRLAAAGRRLTVRPPAGKLELGASRSVVAEILDVLLDNALSHGAGTVAIGVRARDDDWVAIELGDEGEGFAEPVEGAFERRTDRNHGHGIGLALARSLAHAEGGRLAVVSAGPRPVVTLTLPRADHRPRTA